MASAPKGIPIEPRDWPGEEVEDEPLDMPQYLIRETLDTILTACRDKNVRRVKWGECEIEFATPYVELPADESDDFDEEELMRQQRADYYAHTDVRPVDLRAMRKRKADE